MRVRRRAIFRVDSHELVGERLRVEGYLSRTGIQIYDDGYGGERREYRPPEEVFAEDSLASLRGMPVTIRHPRGLVTAKSWKRVAVGHVGDDVARADDGSHTRATIWLHEARAIRGVQDGELVELSVGYTAELEEAAGQTPEGERYDAIQRGIRGNHLALLPQGEARGGPTVRLRLDADGHTPWGDDSIPFERTHESRPRPRADAGDSYMAKQTVKVDGLPFEVEAADNFSELLERERTAIQAKLDAVEEAKAALEANVAEAEQAKTEIEAKLDAATSEVDDLKAKLAEATDPKRLAERAEQRAALIADAKRLAGEAELSLEGEDLEIKRAALEAAGVTLDGKGDVYIEARFDAEVERLGDEPRRRDDSLTRTRRAVAGPDTRTDDTGAEAFSLDGGMGGF